MSELLDFWKRSFRKGQTRVSGAGSRWIGAGCAGSVFLNSSRQGLAPAAITIPSTTPATMATARLTEPGMADVLS